MLLLGCRAASFVFETLLYLRHMPIGLFGNEVKSINDTLINYEQWTNFFLGASCKGVIDVEIPSKFKAISWLIQDYLIYHSKRLTRTILGWADSYIQCRGQNTGFLVGWCLSNCACGSWCVCGHEDHNEDINLISMTVDIDTMMFIGNWTVQQGYNMWTWRLQSGYQSNFHKHWYWSSGVDW